MSPQDKASASRTGLVLSQRGEHSSPAASQPGARDGAGTDLADRAAAPEAPGAGGGARRWRCGRRSHSDPAAFSLCERLVQARCGQGHDSG